MKTLLLFFLLFFSSLSSEARNWYRIYLDTKTYLRPKFIAYQYHRSEEMCAVGLVPPFVRPKGAVFCRMEDYLTAKTKVWIKIGVK